MSNSEELQKLADKLLNATKITLELNSKFWRSDFQGKGAGVYILRNKNGIVVYVGETYTLKHRLKDLLHTHNHGLRRAIFFEFIINDKLPADYKESKEIISNYICNEFTYSYLEVSFGRKELEEYMILKYKSQYLLNKQGSKRL